MAPKPPQFRTRNRALTYSHRSRLLDDFRDGRCQHLQLADIVSHVVEFASDHDGSKFIQRKLDDATDQRKDSLFREMIPNLPMLMMDVFANFVIQKFIDVGSDVHRQVLFAHVQKHFMQLSLHKYGCRVVQKAIEKAPMHTQRCLLQSCVGNNIIQLAQDPNGNHVIQRSFRVVSPSIQTFLFEQIRDHVVYFCFNLYGCRVVQCILEHGTLVHRSETVDQLLRNSQQLDRMIQDRYANYVIQQAIQFTPPVGRNRLIDYILRRVFDFSLQKYASNVVEKCFNLATPEQQSQIIAVLCNQSDEDLRRFCTEIYANFVVQKMIDKANIWQLEILYAKLLPYFDEMGRHVSGRKITNQLIERLGNLQAYDSNFLHF